MKYICIIPGSIDIKEFTKHIDPSEYKNVTNVEELKKVDYLEFTYERLHVPEIDKILYKTKTKYSHSFILKNGIEIKSTLHTIVLKKSRTFFDKYYLPQYDISLSNLSPLKKLDKNALYIVKPIKSNHGVGNKVFRGTDKIKEYLESHKGTFFYKSKKNGENQWVIQKYMENPLLLNGKKFNIRWNVLLANDKVYMYETGAVFPAQLKYDKNDMTMEIHDSHGESSPSEHKCFPNDFFNESYAKDIYKDIYSFLKGMKKMGLFDIECYKEAEKCFGILGIDFMITDKYELKCIEINNRPGFGSSFPFTPHLIEGLLDLTLYEKTKGKGYNEIH